MLFVDELSCLAATPFLMNVKGVDGYNKNMKKIDFRFKVINFYFLVDSAMVAVNLLEVFPLFSSCAHSKQN